MIVTKIERQKRHPRRMNIYLDHEFAFGLHEEILLKGRIREGDALDPATIEIIKSREEFRLAREKAIRLIGRRLRSDKELRLYLTEHEFDPGIIDDVLYDLQTTGIVDDRKFAAAFVHDVQAQKPVGKRVLFQKLRLKGISPAVIEDTLENALPNGQEENLACTTAMRILNRYRSSAKPIPAEQQRERTAKYLARRGFHWGIITPVLKKLFSENSTPED